MRQQPDSPAQPRDANRRVRHIGFVGDDVALTAALQRGHPGAPTALFDRYGAHIRRVLVNVMGLDQEIPDLLHETFAAAFQGVHQLKDGARLKAWLTRIAVFTARGSIRARQRRRWLKFFAPEHVPDTPAVISCAEDREAVQATYRCLERLTADLRVPFALRYIQGMELKEVAAACDVSLATIKRRLNRAQERFTTAARREPALGHWLEEGTRWASR